MRLGAELGRVGEGRVAQVVETLQAFGLVRDLKPVPAWVHAKARA